MHWLKKLFSFQEEEEGEIENEPTTGTNTTETNNKNLQARVTYHYPKNILPKEDSLNKYSREISYESPNVKNKQQLDYQSSLYKRYPRLRKREEFTEQQHGEELRINSRDHTERIEQVEIRNTIKQNETRRVPSEEKQQKSNKKIEGRRYFQPTEIPSPVYGFQKVRKLEDDDDVVEFELKSFDEKKKSQINRSNPNLSGISYRKNTVEDKQELQKNELKESIFAEAKNTVYTNHKESNSENINIMDGNQNSFIIHSEQKSVNKQVSRLGENPDSEEIVNEHHVTFVEIDKQMNNEATNQETNHSADEVVFESNQDMHFEPIGVQTPEENQVQNEKFQTHGLELESILNEEQLFHVTTQNKKETGLVINPFEVQAHLKKQVTQSENQGSTFNETNLQLEKADSPIDSQTQTEESEIQKNMDEFETQGLDSIESEIQIEEINLMRESAHLESSETDPIAEQKPVPIQDQLQDEKETPHIEEEQIHELVEIAVSENEITEQEEINTKSELIEENLFFTNQLSELLSRAETDSEVDKQLENDKYENPSEKLTSTDENEKLEPTILTALPKEVNLEQNEVGNENDSTIHSSNHIEQKQNEQVVSEIASSLNVDDGIETDNEVQIVENTEKENEQSTKNENLEAEESERRPAKKHLPFNVMMLKSDRERLKERENRKRLKEQQTEATIEVTIKQEEIQIYDFPSHELLDLTSVEQSNEKWIEEQTNILNTTLHSFHVGATVVDVSVGPAVTRFELTPELGVKVSKITNLTDDLKLSLAAKDIRIEAPIPGKHTIGIEVPNKNARPVYLREILDRESFTEASSPLTVALGLDIGGKPVVTDLKKMPHGLIAGATGSGKSVCINTFIVSLLYKASPEEVKLLMIDPKMVELAPYNGIPHLLSPVITDVKAATQALKWSVEEMERRYQLFVHAGVRDIGKYNEKANAEQKLPYIVIIIDELADLMMMAPSDVEEAIARIAQKARACGIHLIIATQRPSVDVITGLIKANVPTRIAFSVSSQIDSRTIIDISGAERLLGKGDMLFMENGTSKPIRVQGAFITDEEIERVVEHVRKQGEPQYLFKQEELIRKSDFAEKDDLLFDACEYAVQQGNISTSSLQRHFRIGYNRAARIIDLMEGKGMISEAKGSKPRDVLMTNETLEELKDLI